MVNNVSLFLLSVFYLLQSGVCFYPHFFFSHLFVFCILKKIFVHLQTSKRLQ